MRSTLLLLLLASCNRPVEPDLFAPAPSAKAYPTTIEEPAKLTSIEATPGAAAQELRVACSTCHSIRQKPGLPESAGDLREFHVGLVVKHGDLGCSSCHVAGDATSLHLASGDRIATSDTFRLCVQCHGPQGRDYAKGAHGGMMGHWDTSRGARTRRHCADCHDPHAPKYVGGAPAPGPRDRFLVAEEKGGPHG